MPRLAHNDPPILLRVGPENTIRSPGGTPQCVRGRHRRKGRLKNSTCRNTKPTTQSSIPDGAVVQRWQNRNISLVAVVQSRTHHVAGATTNNTTPPSVIPLWEYDLNPAICSKHKTQAYVGVHGNS